MTEDKQRWSKDVKEDELKKHRCEIRMIAGGFVEDHEDVDLNTNEFRLNDVTRIIISLDIISV